MSDKVMPERPKLRACPAHGSGMIAYCDPADVKLYADALEAQLRQVMEERDAAVEQLSLLPGFILGKHMLVPIGSIADLNAAQNRIAALEAQLQEQKGRGL
jgi:hypothetical protein